MWVFDTNNKVSWVNYIFDIYFGVQCWFENYDVTTFEGRFRNRKADYFEYSIVNKYETKSTATNTKVNLVNFQIVGYRGSVKALYLQIYYLISCVPPKSINSVIYIYVFSFLGTLY